jgi:hypothetical protein
MLVQGVVGERKEAGGVDGYCTLAVTRNATSLPKAASCCLAVRIQLMDTVNT